MSCVIKTGKTDLVVKPQTLRIKVAHTAKATLKKDDRLVPNVHDMTARARVANPTPFPPGGG